MKLNAKRRRPTPVYVFNGKRLRKIREQLQLSLIQVSQLTGIAISSLSDYECGKIVPQVHQFKKLCEAYELDPLEICELIKIKISDPRDIKEFRQACHRYETTPLQAFRDFIVDYANMDQSEQE